MFRLKRCIIWVLGRFICVNHVAVIMDGNRRYAKSKAIKVSGGHAQGFYKLLQMVEICSLFGVSALTVYAFSLLNFRRSKEEICDLINLSIDVLSQNGQLRDFCKDVNCRIRFCGDFSFVGDDIKKMLKDVELKTSQYTGMTLNICLSYGARNEIANALKGKSENFCENLSTSPFGPPEILIRTSGVTRLSDFLIYQASLHLDLFLHG
ncbi:undecaprenyl diphosphate synthase, putative [Theileria equi strain WA]|uniref:Alkyl transferase n=1 Tax=Theileria equi strain WA TaxID=1537102 RepID=L1LC44_THEEQ|nr:undecaprenyl diphosphate synthase, putative [Theileria equi strain WA]EKX72810.1 undecaprenyl diphosphate synthase, putative [Theileria equi strain WA]|eukprot:XP_004832262.1 undecaprenyl diphosphate synthase, putative [Theileria equi strain WA]